MFEVAVLELCTLCRWTLNVSDFGCYRRQTGETYSLQFATWWTLWSRLWCSVNRSV